MKIEPYQGGYRMVASTSAASPIQVARQKGVQAAGSCDSCDAPVQTRQVDRVELSSLQFNAVTEAAPKTAGSQQRIRESLVAGIVNQPIEPTASANKVLNRAYFLGDGAVADFNAAAVGRALDVTG